MALLPALVRDTSGVLSFVPGLLLMGTGVGIMLTASVNLALCIPRKSAREAAPRT